MRQFSQLQSDYLQLLDFYYQVIDSLRGTPAFDARLTGCEHLAMKIFLHAASIIYLSPGTNLTIPTFPGGAHVLDFPSIIVIARAVIETYLTLFEVYFEQLTDDEFEYRHAVYQVSGFRLREDLRFIPLDADFSLVQEVQKGIQELEATRDRIRQTNHYASLDVNQKNSSLQGHMFPKRDFKARCQVAGLGQGETMAAAYAIFSAYIHSDALSAVQLVTVRNDSQKNDFIAQAMRPTMMVMALVIANYCKKFSQAQAVCNSNPAMSQAVSLAVSSASQMK